MTDFIIHEDKAKQSKSPILRQIGLPKVVEDTDVWGKPRTRVLYNRIVYTHWRDGDITRHEEPVPDGAELESVGWQAVTKVDHETYSNARTS